MSAAHWPADKIPGFRPLSEDEHDRLRWLQTRKFTLTRHERDTLARLERRAAADCLRTVEEVT